MSDREALAAALAELERWMKRREVGAAPPLTTVLAAARERLAQLPEKCGTCGGDGSPIVGYPCKDCHGSGKVYPAELVERIKQAILQTLAYPPSESAADLLAVAVLDALNETTP